MILTGENWRTRRNTWPNATLSITNPAWNGPGTNPGLNSWRPEISRVVCFASFLSPNSFFFKGVLYISYTNMSLNEFSGLYIQSPSVVYWLAYLSLDARFEGSNPVEDDTFLIAIKISSTTSFREEVKKSVPCRKILRRVNSLKAKFV
jgi:hypothetical protein